MLAGISLPLAHTKSAESQGHHWIRSNWEPSLNSRRSDGHEVKYYDIVDVLPLGNATADSLEDLLKTSDVVSLHVPATAETAGMMGEQEIRLMKEGAFLLNNARGNVVDALATA